jgi:LDH2 family malate/lactate/ureidoglycolate dehydrogenase
VVNAALSELVRFGTAVLEAIGMQRDDAAFMAGVIVDSDLAGHESHGMRRLPEYVAHWRAGGVDTASVPEIELDTGAVLRVNGRNGFGHTTMRFVTDLAIERARAHGIAAVALRRSNHAGRFADFCERGAAAGVAILFFVNDAGGFQDVAPPGGLEPRLATNPIGAGIPRAGSPHLILDMSTSVVAKGRLMEWRDRGEAIPAGWVTSTGAIRPLGGVKGFGLALVTEALAGALTGAGTVAAEPEHDDQGVLTIAIDVERLRPLPDFTAEVERFIAYVRDVPLEPGADPVRVPGESGEAYRVARTAAGVPVQDHTWAALARLATELGIPAPAVR